MKLILKIFAMLFFVVFLSGCTNNQAKKYDYTPYSTSISTNYENNGYVKSSDMYNNSVVDK